MTQPELAENVKCGAPNCDGVANEPGAAKGYCTKHYQRLRDHGSLADPRPSEAQRFWGKVDVGHPLGCWEWMGGRGGSGHYGLFWSAGRNVQAHRWAYQFFKGGIRPGLSIDHLCRNHTCVNPDHLQAVSISENVRRGVAPDIARRRHRAQTHCKRGHPLSGSNLYRRPDGGRTCRECRKVRGDK